MVLIFRLQLFKPSETFISALAGALKRYRPVYLGWQLHGAPPPGSVIHRPRTAWQALRLFVFGEAEAVRPQLPHDLALVHAHFGVDAIFALALARRLGVPLVVTLHGFDVSRSRRSLLLSFRPALIAFVVGWRALTRHADLFVAVSSSVRTAALRRGVPTDRLTHLVIGVDTERLQPTVASEPYLIVQVGRLVEKKGAHILIHALARLQNRWPQARLVLIGEGRLRTALEAQVARLGLSGRVQFMGALPHPAALDWMRRAAVVAVPSIPARNGDAEGLATVLLEAAALGRPIVASEASGASEVFTHRHEALIVPAGDPSALPDGLDELFSRPDLAASLAAAARRRVEEACDLQRQTQTLERLYDRVIHGRPRGVA